MNYETNIHEIVRRAMLSLEENMAAEDRVPAPGQEPAFVYEPETNSYRLEVMTIAREECPHLAGVVAISVLSSDGTGRIVTVNHCPICKAVV